MSFVCVFRRETAMPKKNNTACSLFHPTPPSKKVHDGGRHIATPVITAPRAPGKSNSDAMVQRTATVQCILAQTSARRRDTRRPDLEIAAQIGTAGPQLRRREPPIACRRPVRSSCQRTRQSDTKAPAAFSAPIPSTNPGQAVRPASFSPKHVARPIQANSKREPAFAKASPGPTVGMGKAKEIEKVRHWLLPRSWSGWVGSGRVVAWCGMVWCGVV